MNEEIKNSKNKFELEGNVANINDVYTNQKGFFAIYHSNCENTVPLIFERNYSDSDNSFDGKHFIAWNDDRVDIEDIIYNKDVVNSYIDSNLLERLDNKGKDMFK